MSEAAFQEQRTVERAKCAKCGQKQATRDDQLCDTCRFLQALDSLAKNNQW